MLTNRIKSFSWRLGALVITTLLTWFVRPDVLQALEDDGVRVPATLALIASLVVAEITKWLNSGRA